MAIIERDPQSLSLDALILRHGAIPEFALSGLLFDVLSIMVHLHGAGMIHNDIDPRSFFLSTTSGELKVLLIGYRAAGLHRCVAKHLYPCRRVCTNILIT